MVSTYAGSVPSEVGLKCEYKAVVHLGVIAFCSAIPFGMASSFDVNYCCGNYLHCLLC